MARRFDTEIRVTQGGRQAVVLGNERKYHMGPAEGTWWTKYSWWVIPAGVAIVIVPWLILSGVIGGGSGRVAQRGAQPVVVRPVVVIQQAPPPAPSAPADPTVGMSPEDRRLYDRLVLRK